MDDLISVIVPVYNASKYLEECVGSILSQTYSNIEILLIDDGSSDNSLDVCCSFAKNDKRVRVFHQENAGPGAARNKGIEEANGEWLAFVDSDDTISHRMYEDLLQIANNHTVDMVCSKIYQSSENIAIKILNRKQALESRLVTKEISDSSCDKIFSRKLFLKNKYPEGRFLSEDTALIYRLISESSKVALINKNYYHIRNSSESLSRKCYASYFSQTIVTYQEMVEFFEKTGEMEFVSVAQNLAAGAVFFNAGEYHLSKFSDKSVKGYIKQRAKEQKKNYLYLSRKNKFLLSMISKCFWFFGFIYKIKG